ncbi:hypothetical protein N7456_004131 [Penicillium angulare]|uniref:SGNH hydrolase-type esterase domain-containing protein n=1 Tax=Penicillium angulare TaxID=116970 RepID=A0A9W9FVY3_9EURO|nr:hypothetical protein N7456_004131 [Penicillium angulare]
MTADNKRLRIVSVGSSFAAGPGIPPQLEPLSARRSGQNYPHLVAKELNAELTDLTVSGATLLNITVEPQTAVLSKDVFPPQIESIPEDADIITVTAGGNDIGYIGNMIFDAGTGTTMGWMANAVIQTIRSAVAIFSTAQETPTPLSPEELSQRMGDVLDQIHKKAPKARVYLVEYLAVVGPSTKPGVDISFTQENIDHHCQVASSLQNAYIAAAGARSEWCERVPIHELSLKHVLGSQEPWVGGFNLYSLIREGIVLHPNLDGMKAVANILLPKIQKNLAARP